MGKEGILKFYMLRFFRLTYAGSRTRHALFSNLLFAASDALIVNNFLFDLHCSDEQGDHPRPLPVIKELKHATDITIRKQSPAWDYDVCIVSLSLSIYIVSSPFLFHCFCIKFN